MSVTLTYAAIEDDWPEDHPLEGHAFRDFWQGGHRTPTWPKTEDLLKRELDMLGARSAVLRIDAGMGDFRRDGGLRADARPGHPGVILQVVTRHGPLTFVTDRFRTWQDNVRAIALALEGLRRLDRYGITRSGQQYLGWTALPAGEGAVPDEPVPMSRAEATKIVCELADSAPLAEMWAVLTEEVRKTVVRNAQRKAHPDTGGDAASFVQLTEALKVLDYEDAEGVRV